jgi:hypothetical protein
MNLKFISLNRPLIKFENLIETFNSKEYANKRDHKLKKKKTTDNACNGIVKKV